MCCCWWNWSSSSSSRNSNTLLIGQRHRRRRRRRRCRGSVVGVDSIAPMQPPRPSAPVECRHQSLSRVLHPSIADNGPSHHRLYCPTCRALASCQWQKVGYVECCVYSTVLPSAYRTCRPRRRRPTARSFRVLLAGWLASKPAYALFGVT
ncbi:hypothetical protein BKA80DRAFT_50137 [Phyllosticta citrichinensis]